MSMPAAQAQHDAAEPPEPLFCRFCDGQREVVVSEIKDAGGVRYSFDMEKTEAQSMACPICVLEMEVGVEVLA